MPRSFVSRQYTPPSCEPQDTTMGRPRKSIAEVLRVQSFRADRRAERLASAAMHAPKRPPDRPTGMPAAARRIWDVLVVELEGLVGPRDAFALRMLCEALAEYFAAMKTLRTLEAGSAE